MTPFYPHTYFPEAIGVQEERWKRGKRRLKKQESRGGGKEWEGEKMRDGGGKVGREGGGGREELSLLNDS